MNDGFISRLPTFLLSAVSITTQNHISPWIFTQLSSNKFHYAITGQTPAVIVHTNADADKKFMGLTTWKNGHYGRIVKSDAKVQKIISFTMEAFGGSVNKFLSFNEYEILSDKGSVSHGQAMEKVALEYDKFNKTQKIESDFDREMKTLPAHKKS